MRVGGPSRYPDRHIAHGRAARGTEVPRCAPRCAPWCAPRRGGRLGGKEAEMLVKEVMTRWPVVVEPGTTAREALRLLDEHTITAMPVVDAQERVVGVVRDADVSEAVALMTSRALMSLPVVDDERRPVGVLSRGDVVHLSPAPTSGPSVTSPPSSHCCGSTGRRSSTAARPGSRGLRMSGAGRWREGPWPPCPGSSPSTSSTRADPDGPTAGPTGPDRPPGRPRASHHRADLGQRPARGRR
jgi:CBS domain-containing protein